IFIVFRSIPAEKPQRGRSQGRPIGERNGCSSRPQGVPYIGWTLAARRMTGVRGRRIVRAPRQELRDKWNGDRNLGHWIHRAATPLEHTEIAGKTIVACSADIWGAEAARVGGPCQSHLRDVPLSHH